MLGCFESFFIIFSIRSLILLISVRRWSICGIPNEVTAFSKNVFKVPAILISLEIISSPPTRVISFLELPLSEKKGFDISPKTFIIGDI